MEIIQRKQLRRMSGFRIDHQFASYPKHGGGFVFHLTDRKCFFADDSIRIAHEGAVFLTPAIKDDHMRRLCLYCTVMALLATGLLMGCASRNGHCPNGNCPLPNSGPISGNTTNGPAPQWGGSISEYPVPNPPPGRGTGTFSPSPAPGSGYRGSGVR